jgi:hypothetical protein
MPILALSSNLHKRLKPVLSHLALLSNPGRDRKLENSWSYNDVDRLPAIK